MQEVFILHNEAEIFFVLTCFWKSLYVHKFIGVIRYTTLNLQNP